MWIWKLISHLEGELILQALLENVYGSHLVMNGKLGHDNKHCPMSKDWRSVCPQYGDWLRAGWTAKEIDKENYSSKEKDCGVSAKQGIQEMVWPATGSSSEGFWVRGLKGGKTSIGKGVIGEGGNITHVDGWLPENVQAINDVSK